MTDPTPRQAPDASDVRTYDVPAISCDHCKHAIESEVATVDGVRSVDVDVDGRLVVVAGGSDDAIRAAIDDAGYDVATG